MFLAGFFCFYPNQIDGELLPVESMLRLTTHQPNGMIASGEKQALKVITAYGYGELTRVLLLDPTFLILQKFVSMPLPSYSGFTVIYKFLNFVLSSDGEGQNGILVLA